MHNPACFLLTIFLLLTSASLWADHRPGHKPGGGGTPEPSGLVLLDSDDPKKAVGEVITITGTSTVLIRLQIQDRSTLVSVHRDEAIGMEPHITTLLFTSDDCRDGAWATNEIGFEGQNWLDGVFIMSGEEGDPFARTPFHAVGLPGTRTIESSLDATGNCTDTNPEDLWVWPLDPLDDDLHLIYPPPYSLSMP
jgi:hypothetical protein